MRELIEYVTKQIVTSPDDVEVIEDRSSESINFSLRVNPADMGLVIGKGGQIIKAIRKLLTVRAIVENARVSLYLVETPASQQA